jgi:hypothetical protein
MHAPAQRLTKTSPLFVEQYAEQELKYCYQDVQREDCERGWGCLCGQISVSDRKR